MLSFSSVRFKKMHQSLLLVCAVAAVAAPVALFPVLPSNVTIGKQADASFLLPTSQLLRPWGQEIALKGRPVDAAFDTDARVMAVVNTDSVDLFDVASAGAVGSFPLKVSSYAGVAFRPESRELWVSETVRKGNDNVVVIDLDKKSVTRIALKGHEVPCGIGFSRDGRTGYVAMSRSNTVAVIDAAAHTVTKEVAVGIAPFGVVVASTAGRVFVSNRGGRRPTAEDTTAPTSGSDAVTDPVSGTTTSGTVTVMDSRSLSVGVAAVPQFPKGLMGSQPVAVAWSRDGKRLYAACGGINAIVALERRGPEWSVVGALPTGWFPSAILVDAGNALHVVNIKGVGNTMGADGTFNSRNFEGSVEVVPMSGAAELAAGLREVAAANAPKLAASGGVENLPSLGINHVFFIIKENRTYDQVFGDIAKGNGDPQLTMFGREVTPNHHALVEKYVLLDNFHDNGAISFDGHQWLMQSFVSDYTERAFAASPRGYAWNMADALTVAPTGFFWQGLPGQRAFRPLSIRISGEFCLPATVDTKTANVVDINEEDVLDWPAYWKMYQDGTWRAKVRETAGVPAIAKYLDVKFPFNSTVVPDQMRADAFLDAFHEMETRGDAPQLNVIALTADHTNGTKPGSPTPRAMVADDDYAIGRMVEAISKSRFWKDSLIFIVEDDAQNGRDHVDGHRTVALAIGPHIRRGAVDSNFYTQSSMVRTIQEIFRIPPQTRFVAAARTMASIFTADADMSSYEAVPAKIAFDEMDPPVRALKGERRWAAEESARMNWKEVDQAPSAGNPAPA